ncbi:hypothetical protein DRH27_00040 [Candidatus Falkowbacteria bacterium]|nr:MAG: hypothetical protein DRH27_00040 [Candidatus Falkowbacteria bacterium]
MDNVQELRKHPACKAYVMHGFEPVQETGEHIIGVCPFCGHKEHKNDYTFYVNTKSKDKGWDCKSCGREGGYQMFLRQIVDLCAENFKGGAAISLAKNRSLKLSTLKAFKMGWNPKTQRYCIPVYTASGDKLQDVRIYDGKKVMSTAGCNSGLLNWPALPNCKGTVWLCEGEWDAMAMYEILRAVGCFDDIVLSVPGAGTFKADWLALFKGKKVNVIYDNDKPGQKGALKVFNFLKQLVRELLFVNWPEGTENRFDLRDLYKLCKLDAGEAFRLIIEMLKEYPQDFDESDININEPESYDGKGLTSQDVYKAYQEHLHLPKTDVIDFLYGTIISNLHLSGDPIWSFLVAPSGFTKSELLMSISAAKNIHTEDNLSMAGLVSGYTAGGVDQSLLPALNGKVLVTKDFTTILKSRIEAREAIFGALRTIYDGVYKHRFGNVQREYNSKFGFIAGVTPAIEYTLENESSLGERFLRYSLKLPNTMEEELQYIMRAASNTTKENNMRGDLQAMANECLNYDYPDNVTIPKEIETKMFYLAMFVSYMRGSIERDKFSKEILYKPIREIGTRIVKQFTKLLKGICMFRRITVATESEFSIIRELARGTIPGRLNDTLSTCYGKSYDASYTPKQVSSFIKLPEPVCDMVLKSLYMLEVFERRKKDMKTDYVFREDFLKIIQGSEVYK